MRKLLVFSAVIFLLAIFGCGNDSTGPSENDDYMPLEVGNQWNYSLSGQYITAAGDTTTISGTILTEVLGVTTHQQGFQLYMIQDSTTTIMTTPDTSFTSVETTIVYAYETGTELRMYDDTTTTDYQLFMKLPVTLGDSWIPDTPEPTITRKVFSLSASVTVPAGTYTGCANLRDTDSTEPDFYFDLFFSRGTGLVQYIVNVADSSGTIYLINNLSSSIIN